MIIFIRHSKEDKKISNHHFDEHISSEGKISAKNLGEKMVKKFGIPDIVYTSPYNRTLETAKALIDERDIELYFLNELSRFYPKKEPIDISEKTKDEDIPLHESKYQFKKRIKKLMRLLEKEIKKHDLIWCITHTSVLKQIAKFFHIEMDDWIQFNDYIIIRKKHFSKIREINLDKRDNFNKIREINLDKRDNFSKIREINLDKRDNFSKIRETLTNKEHHCPYCKFKAYDRSSNRAIGVQKLF